MTLKMLYEITGAADSFDFSKLGQPLSFKLQNNLKYLKSLREQYPLPIEELYHKYGKKDKNGDLVMGPDKSPLLMDPEGFSNSLMIFYQIAICVNIPFLVDKKETQGVSFTPAQVKLVKCCLST